MKKFLKNCLVLCLVCMLVLVASCSGKPSNSSSNGDTIELKFWTINLKEGYSDYIKEKIKKYEDAHQGVKITWLDIPDFNQTTSKLLSALSGGNVPDVVNLTPFLLPKFVNAGALTNINDLDPKLSEKYLPAFWNAGVINDEPYAIPFYGSVPAVIINTDIFEKAGLDPNQSPKTWEDVAKYSETIKQKTGISGSMQTLDDFADSGNPIDILARRGVKLLSDDHKKAVFNSPEGVKVLQEYVDMYKSGALNKDSLTGDMMDAAAKFSQEKTAMIFLGPWILRWLKDNTDENTFKHFKANPGIEGQDGSLNAFLQNFAIPKKSKHPKEALDFANYFSGTTVELMKLAPVAPTQKDQYNDSVFQSPTPEIELIQKGVPKAKFFWPLVPGLTDLIEALRNEFQNASLGKKSPQEALDDAAKKWDEILSNN